MTGDLHQAAGPAPLISTLDRHAGRQLLGRLMLLCGLVMVGGMVMPTLTGSKL